MEMPAELNSHDLYLIFWDLSLDAIRPYLSAMGLNRPEDVKFTMSLAPVMDSHAKISADKRNEEQAVTQILQLAHQYGSEYAIRIMDWSRLIYPNSSQRQQQISRWRTVVIRGGSRTGEKVPRLVEETRAVLRKFAPVIATDVKPVTERDKLHYLDREEEGISPFEWVEAAVRTYTFLYAWNFAVGRQNVGGELDQVYSWAVREGESLRTPKGLARPEEQLALPPSLASV